jgi:hypothetical protein
MAESEEPPAAQVIHKTELEHQCQSGFVFTFCGELIEAKKLVKEKPDGAEICLRCEKIAAKSCNRLKVFFAPKDVKQTEQCYRHNHPPLPAIA